MLINQRLQKHKQIKKIQLKSLKQRVLNKQQYVEIQQNFAKYKFQITILQLMQQQRIFRKRINVYKDKENRIEIV
ncbi:unnamed protein product [Paramecium sonneborni]|uniref:Uncharacterized protein n=1 Tax=Paramecium sonneborni TaxID=65129 RepID=A0A8S1Q5U4_9CILI|nr:unnamed protein product [Paramecium sonneborni]